MDCQKPAPDGLFWLMHSFIVPSLPLYLVAIVALFRINSTYFETYKNFLIWHTFMNLLSEIYNSWFLLPVVHHPHPLLRMTGIMTQLGFNGLFQFYIINALIYQTAYSIIEMFMFRFRASIISYKTRLFYKYLRAELIFFRLTMLWFVVMSFSTYSYAIEKQEEYRQQLIRSSPDSPPELLCFSVVVAAPFSDPVNMSNIIIWVTVIVVTVSLTCTTTLYMDRHLRNNEHHSPATVRMQKMLLISLFVQTVIHLVMLGVPNILFVYAAFRGVRVELIAHIAFVCLTLHGFFSTIAMIYFTKPIKHSILSDIMNVLSTEVTATVLPSEQDCLAAAPDPYKSAMQFTHFLTIPLYFMAIYTLINKCPKALKEYRNYLLWHTIGNLVFEIFISIFMLPVTYLPYPVFRGSGLLKFLNVSGLIQFYLLVICMIHTGLSILEMFKYRFDAAISDETLNKKVLHKIVAFFWIIVIIIPIFCFATLPRCHPKQEHYKQELYDSNPGVSIQVLCNTAVTAPPLLDPVFSPLMSLIITAMLTACIIIPQTFLTIWKKLDQLAKHLSKRTVRLQKMLLISLFIQAVIHGVMLGAPLIGFIYAIVFVLPHDNVAYVLLMLVSFHGSVSTIAMVGFTKPIRTGVVSILQTFFPFLRREKPPIVIAVTETTSASGHHKDSITMSRKIFYQ
ncbi:unnamed protein product [Caenorhabditis sp. 36 PRJEB53466]|nr:unnamed protein product [Caenorhabditis sp. 36 PRJEB53466]